MSDTEENDDITMLREYRFEWEDEPSRETTDDDAFETDSPHPKAVETLAELGKRDPDCTVTMTGMST